MTTAEIRAVHAKLVAARKQVVRARLCVGADHVHLARQELTRAHAELSEAVELVGAAVRAATRAEARRFREAVGA